MGSYTQESNRMELVWISQLVKKGHISLKIPPDFLNVGEKEPSIWYKEVSASYSVILKPDPNAHSPLQRIVYFCFGYLGILSFEVMFS